jgi:microcin C transport system ATP-binding protein
MNQPMKVLLNESDSSSEKFLLQVRNLEVAFQRRSVVKGIDFQIGRGERVALVGESGSGKSITALSLLGLARGARVSGECHFEGKDLIKLGERELRTIRGKEISMIFQEPMTALNPLFTVGDQIAEVLEIKMAMSKHAAWLKAIDLMDEMGITEPSVRARAYPHQLSGGQRQRVMIAMALACRPKLLLADEPTTALDASLRLQILGLLKRFQKEYGTSILLITHDLNLVHSFAEKVMVMQHGRVVEQGAVLEVMRAPQHPYTQRLISSVPSRDVVELCAWPEQWQSVWSALWGGALNAREGELGFKAKRGEKVEKVEKGQRSGEVNGQVNGEVKQTLTGGVTANEAAYRPLAMQVHDLSVHYPVPIEGFRGWFKKGRFTAVQGVSFELLAAQTLGIVGESGSGKSTLALACLGLLGQTAEQTGEVRVLNQSWGEGWHKRTLRALVQVVFQDPFSSLSPRMNVFELVGEGLRVHAPEINAELRQNRVLQALAEVSLTAEEFPGLLERYPHEFSGGQRQRLAIARALILNPKILVLDEPTSALDVTSQKQVVELLQRLQRARGLSYLLITHDISIIKAMAHQVLVMKDGRVIESASTDQVLNAPSDPYTRDLVRSSLSGQVQLE